MQSERVCVRCGVDVGPIPADLCAKKVASVGIWLCDPCFERWVRGADFPLIQPQEEPDHRA